MVNGYYPHTITEVLTCKKEHPQARLIAGGTDFMVVKPEVEDLIFLNRVTELSIIKEEENVLTIGAGAVYADLLQNNSIPVVLKNAISQIASPAIRNAGTIGGNVCNASPAGDTLPVLYALSADVVKASLAEDGSMQIVEEPIAQFIQHIRKIDLREDEMVTAIKISKEAYEGMNKVVYEKVGARRSEAISKLSFVGLAKINDNIIKDVRISFGAVSVTALRIEEAEGTICGLSKEDAYKQKEVFMAFYDEAIRPIDDQRSTAVYRKKVCMNLLEDFFRQLTE